MLPLKIFFSLICLNLVSTSLLPSSKNVKGENDWDMLDDLDDDYVPISDKSLKDTSNLSDAVEGLKLENVTDNVFRIIASDIYEDFAQIDSDAGVIVLDVADTGANTVADNGNSADDTVADNGNSADDTVADNDNSADDTVAESIAQNLSLNQMSQTVTVEELDLMLAKPISNENLESLKLLIKNGQLEPLISKNHIETLCQNPTGNTFVILKLLSDCPWFKFKSKIEDKLLFWLRKSILNDSFDEFKYIWTAFNGKNLPNSVIVELLLATVFETIDEQSQKYYLFLDEIRGLESFRGIFNEFVIDAIEGHSVIVLEFILKTEGSLSYLDTDQKIKALYSVVGMNRISFVKIILEDELVRSKVLKVKDPKIIKYLSKKGLLNGNFSESDVTLLLAKKVAEKSASSQSRRR